MVYQTQYSFPMLTPAEIVQCLAELSIPGLTEDSLKRPTHETIMPVYEMLLDILMDVRREKIQQPNFDDLEIMEHPELHVKSIPTAICCKALTKLMSVCGVHDFTLRDVFMPDYQRTRKYLSAIINFAKFRDERLERYQHYLNEGDELANQKITVEEKYHEMVDQLSVLNDEQNRERPAVEALTEEVAGLQEKYNEIIVKKNALKEKNSTIKESETDLSDKINQSLVKIELEKQECQRLSSQIVRSPERIKKETGQQRQELSREREKVVTQERKSRDLLTKLNSLEKVEVDIRKSISMTRDCENELLQTAEHMKNQEIKSDDIQRLNGHLKDLGNTEQLHKRKISVAHEKLARINKQNDSKRDHAKMELERVRKERQQLDKEREVIQGQIDQLEEQAKKIQQQDSANELAHTEKMASLRKQHSMLTDTIRNYHQAIAVSLAQVGA